jgi:hypothetical protein
VYGRGTMVHGGTIVMVCGFGASSVCGVVAMGVGDVPMLCLQETGRSELPSPLEIM